VPARHRFRSWAGNVNRTRARAAVLVTAVSLGWGCVITISAYALMRAAQVLISPDPNPAQVAWGIHAGYVWRVWTVTYAGGIATFIVSLMARRRVESYARALIPALGVAVALLVLQTVLFP
jgi:hypothetical protein